MPLGGLATAGAIAGISAGVKGISAWNQNRKAKKIQANRPTYQIPQEILNNQAMYKNLANSSRLPGQANLENQIGVNNSSAINAAMQGAGSSADILASIGNVNNNTNSALNNLAVEGAQNQNMNRDKLAQSNESLAQYRDQAFDYNKNEPYQQAYARKQALQTAANANLQNGLQDATNFSTAMLANGDNNNPAWGSNPYNKNKKTNQSYWSND